MPTPVRQLHVSQAAGIVQQHYGLTIKEVKLMSDDRIYELAEQATEKQQIHNTYFKVGENLISGRPLPTDDDGKVRNKVFVGCRFHPNCGDVEFMDCEFVNCEGLDYLEEFMNKRGVK